MIATRPRRATLARAAALLLLPTLFGSALLAQVPEGPGPVRQRALTQYGIDTWDDRVGLPQNSVQAITQSSDGYMWFGTQEGLARFDGVRFKTYGRGSKPALPRPYVWALAPAAAGGVWVGTEEAGLLHVQDGQVTSYTVAEGMPSNYVMALLHARDGTLWIGTIGGGLARRRNGRIEVVDSTRFPFRSVTALTEAGQGVVWVAAPRGIARIQGDSIASFTQADGLPAGAISLAPARGGGVWLGTMAGNLARIAADGSVVRTWGAADGLPGGPIAGLNEDENGSLWIGMGTALARMTGGQISVLPDGHGPGADVGALYRDHERSLWVGTNGGGVVRLRETPIVPLGPPEGLSSTFALAIYQDRAGDMWIGTGGAGVNRLHGDSVVVYNQANGSLPGDIVIALTQARDGAMWVGTGGGVSRIQNGRATLFTAADGLASVQVRAILEDRAGRLWFATNIGLQRFRPGAPVLYKSADGLADDYVMTLLEDPDGSLWIGTREGLSHFQDGRFTTLTHQDGLPDAPVSSLYLDRDGTMWIAGYGALTRLRDGRFTVFGLADGLCDDVIHHILEDDDGRLWLNSNRGIFYLQRSELNDYVAGRSPKLRCQLYGRGDGMRSREGNGAVNPAGWRAADGRLWFPTVGGVVIVDPRKVDSGIAPPRVAIEEIVVGDVVHSPPPALLPAGTRDLQIHFTALSFVAPERVHFRYRLEGFDDEWVDAGNRRVAYYTNLPAGRYTFHVMAANADGAWNEEGSELAFRIRPHLWEAGWFRVLCVTAALSFIVLLYRRRVHRLERHAQKLLGLVKERSRAEARYRELFENASDAVFTTDLEGNVTALNRKAEELTGYTLAEAVRLNVRDLLPPEADERFVREWLEGKTRLGTLIEVIARDGKRVPLEISSRLVREGAEPVGIQAIARDMRERAALERQLQQSQKMEAIGQLAGGIAHDFNNLLTVIRGSAEFLLAELPGESASRPDVDEIAAAADRAAGLTRQLLAFSRKEVVEPRPLDLNDLLRGLEPMLHRLIGEDITVTTLPSGAPARVMADAGQLEQVLINLAVNARDAMPAGGSLTIKLSLMEIADEAEVPVRSSAGRCVVLAVTDTGTGMDAITQARIFEPFFTTKELGKGTGLGLSTVYGIVHQAGGKIRCASKPGHGTTFRIYLPYFAAASQLADDALDGTVVGGTETILLVEDEDAVRALATRILRGHGYTVLATRHGQDALQRADQHQGPIDLVLTDVVMPVLSGRELVEQLARRRPMRVLFMSGYTDDEILRRGLYDQNYALLHKPFTAAALGRAVRDALDRPAPSLAAAQELLTA